MTTSISINNDFVVTITFKNTLGKDIELYHDGLFNISIYDESKKESVPLQVCVKRMDPKKNPKNFHFVANNNSFSFDIQVESTLFNVSKNNSYIISYDDLEYFDVGTSKKLKWKKSNGTDIKVSPVGFVYQ
jgi:hypothetical protein